jgi:hypothetical protein
MFLNWHLCSVAGKSNDTTGKGSQSLAEVIADVVNELSDRQSEITRQNSTAEMLQADDDTQVIYLYHLRLKFLINVLLKLFRRWIELLLKWVVKTA